MTSLYIISMTWVTDINLANQLEGKNIGCNEVKKKSKQMEVLQQYKQSNVWILQLELGAQLFGIC